MHEIVSMKIDCAYEKEVYGETDDKLETMTCEMALSVNCSSKVFDLVFLFSGFKETK